MNGKLISAIFILALFIVNLVFADCGGDHDNVKGTIDASAK